jgi:hypothetical protein
MTKKTTNPTPETHSIEGRDFVWHGTDGDVRIPLRLPLGVVRRVAGKDLDADVMFEILDALIPDAEALDAMDLIEFQTMFLAWQSAYNEQTGASLGESSR